MANFRMEEKMVKENKPGEMARPTMEIGQIIISMVKANGLSPMVNLEWENSIEETGQDGQMKTKIA